MTIDINPFRVIAPSDIWYRGSFARYCIKENVKRNKYANQSQKLLIEQYGRKYGCHHCGLKDIISSTFRIQTRSLRIMWNKWNVFNSNLSLTEYIADHIPPSKLNRRKRQKRKHMRNNKIKRILLPQCQDLFIKTSTFGQTK